jgi:hypothetical protein
MIKAALSAANAYNQKYLFEPGLLQRARLPQEFERDFSTLLNHVAKSKLTFGIIAPLDQMQRLTTPSTIDRRRS